ncbi:TSUP family transporter [Desulforhopalus sp. 52FAK]
MFDPSAATQLFSEFSRGELFFAVTLLFIASLIRGLTGFGFSAILVTGLSFIIIPSQTVVLALLLEIIASAHLLPRAWKNINWGLIGALGIGILVGTPVGMSLLAYTNPDTMRLVISSTVLVFALLILKGLNYNDPRTLTVHSGLGLISGICNGTAALGGLPIVTFLLSTDAQVASTRATLIATFFATDIYALIFAGSHGMIGGDALIFAVVSLPVLVFGVAIGQRVFNVASPDFFKKIALVLLLILSLTGIVRALVMLIYH